MSTETYPMTGYTDTGTTPHWVARLHPNTSCCGQPLVSVPNHQERWDPMEVCRACRHSGVTPLPYNHDPTSDQEVPCRKPDGGSSAPPATGGSA